jgi:hypothetical protein
MSNNEFNKIKTKNSLKNFDNYNNNFNNINLTINNNNISNSNILVRNSIRKTINNKNENYKDYFFMLYQAIKMNSDNVEPFLYVKYK